ncbi:hypothetical protein BDN72DRAFT_836020 [Pluteus cervinus]|uniref:Uncharacterized protein n=1 Tax=Pluteus cervinus TaxID=181527 RepID=A0ACD3B3X5_9AGAR|nr:hypothetical protein BDN72DRAFT_836020 [Pluteus cervinus]
MQHHRASSYIPPFFPAHRVICIPYRNPCRTNTPASCQQPGTKSWSNHSMTFRGIIPFVVFAATGRLLWSRMEGRSRGRGWSGYMRMPSFTLETTYRICAKYICQLLDLSMNLINNNIDCPRIIMVACLLRRNFAHICTFDFLMWSDY